ncbi:uncharacterized protein MYCFIDRAFT_183014, partial [Pseudocercospora fijiensis CIRAD86]
HSSQDESEVEKEASSTPEAQEKKDESQKQVNDSHYKPPMSAQHPLQPVQQPPVTRP